MRTKNVFLFTILLLTLPLAACGIRPQTLEPPAGAENKEYPRTYPDPSTLDVVVPAPPAP